MKRLWISVALGSTVSALAGISLAVAAPHGGGAGFHSMGAASPMGTSAGFNASGGSNRTPTTVTSTTVRGPALTGQPKQSCGSLSAPETPGNAASAPGSAFNPDGNAGTHYAGQQPQNSTNTASVSQYDAACSHQR